MGTFILYCIYVKYFNKLIEGATGDSSTYQDTNQSQDPVFMATTNASNIKYLKDRLDEITTFRTTLDSMNTQVNTNTTAIQGLNDAIASSGTDAVPDQQTTDELADSGNIEPPGSV
jgi:capsule polysaccharide export protein KpsE/RkpR